MEKAGSSRDLADPNYCQMKDSRISLRREQRREAARRRDRKMEEMRNAVNDSKTFLGSLRRRGKVLVSKRTISLQVGRCVKPNEKYARDGHHIFRSWHCHWKMRNSIQNTRTLWTRMWSV